MKKSFRSIAPFRTAKIAALLLILPLGLLGSSAGQGAPASAEPPRPPIERATSELVLIEAYVTNPSGLPIKGLTADQFTLTVDGRRTPIDSFEFRDLTAPSDGIPGVVTAEGPGPASEGPPRRFMLFFEDGTSAPMGLTRARRAADEFLSTGLAPSDLVGLSAYDTGLRILHDFTPDRDALRAAIDLSLHDGRRISDLAVEINRRIESLNLEVADVKEADRTAQSRARANTGNVPLIQGASSRQGPGGGGDAGGVNLTGSDIIQKSQKGFEVASALNKMKFEAFSYAADDAPRMRSVLQALRTLVDSMAQIRGYKSIVFMGDGIPENSALYYIEPIAQLQPDQQLTLMSDTYSMSSDLQALVQDAAAAGVTIHTLQTRGLEAGTAAELRSARSRSNSLQSVALSTGGLYSASNDALKALYEFETSSRSYYILGFKPEGSPDGRFHPVQVRCKKGASVRWRKGFTRLPPAEARARIVQAAHLLPELYTQIPIELSAVAGPAVSKSRITDLVVHVPAGSLLFLPEGGRPTAHLEVSLVAVDEASREVVKTSRTLRVALPQASGPSAASGSSEPPGLDIVYRVLIPAAAQSIVAVVQDSTGGLLGGARIALPPETEVAGRVLGLSIYSLREKSLWIELPDERFGDAVAGGAAAGGAPAGGVTDYVSGPTLRTTFPPDEPLLCAFRMPVDASPIGSTLQVVVRRGDETLRILPLQDGIAAAGGTVHVPLSIEGLPAGDYVLAVQEVPPPGSGNPTATPGDRGTAPFRIRPA